MLAAVTIASYCHNAGDTIAHSALFAGCTALVVILVGLSVLALVGIRL